MADGASVLVVEDDDLWARRVEHALALPVERVATLEDARRAVAGRTFHLAIVDVGMPDGDGLRFAEQLPRAHRPALVILTGDATSKIRARVDEIGGHCFEKGELRAQELAQILGHHLDRAVARARETEERKRAVARTLGEEHGLTPTEKEVLELVGLGYDRKEMAAERGVGVNCIKKHLMAIFTKLERVIPERTTKAIECWIIDQALWEAVSER